MQLTKRFIIKPQPKLIRLCKVSNDLYNQSLYHWRQRRDDDGVFLTEFQLRREMRDVPNLDGEYNYRLLKARMADQTIKEVHLAIMTFFNAMKDWKQHPEKYKAMPAFPRYHKSGGLTMIQIDSQYFRIRNGRIIYDRGKNLGIDILCTVVSPCGCTIYNGRQLKSFNQGCNKEIAKAKSILMQQQPDIKNANSKRLRAMYDRRNRFMETFMHTLSRQIVNQLIGEHVGVLVVGFNKGWKQDTGKAVNADMNGALNILRKHLGDECYQQLTADWPLTKPPVRVNVI